MSPLRPLANLADLETSPPRQRLPGLLLSLLLGLTACAATAPPTRVTASVAPQWQAPLPHNGALTDLSQWWQAQGDPLLVELIDAAQQVSPTIAAARSRMAQARATRVTAGAALGPSLDASLSASRGPLQSTGQAGGVGTGGTGSAGGVGTGFSTDSPIATTLQAGLQTAWEIDLFGGNRASRDAAQARLEGAEAQWHDARVSVAAEVANQYLALRSCNQLFGVAEADATSRAETARLTGLSAEAGFTAPASAALARASAAEARGRVTQQRALCEIDTKALVALTGISEPDIKQKVASALTHNYSIAPVSIANLPAQVISQRPDVFTAEREVDAASGDVGSADAQRFPRLSLSGSIGATNIRVSGVSADFSTWSIGPLALSLPLWDGGQRAANADAAKVRYDEAVTSYRAKVRQAVREVEEALVNLQSTASRSDDARMATEGYRASFRATESRFQSGLASLVELEDARRTALAAETTQVTLQRERMAAWVALYRAAGGGWQPRQAGPDVAATARKNTAP